MLYVKERLGHASITTTVNQYGHMFPSVEASLADALDGMYEGAQPPRVPVAALRTEKTP
jgi:hypothetical protein